MGDELNVTLIANAGLLLEYRGTALLLDAVYGGGHPFSELPPGCLELMAEGRPPFERLDYLLFTHRHPDHFSPELTRQLLERRRVKGVFLPGEDAEPVKRLEDFLLAERIPCVPLSRMTDHAAYQTEPSVTVRAFSTAHLDKKYRGVGHFCYLISFGGKNVLFTSDVDYVGETLPQLSGIHLRAAFVNPLFFNALRCRSFFLGELDTEAVCVYHIPFPGDDRFMIRRRLRMDLAAWPPSKPEAIALTDAYQRIVL